MRRSKAYLSKSKAGNFNDIIKAKNYLELLGFEVVEFQGGMYSNKPLLSCDRLFILPPCLKENPTIGKGQYEEICAFRKQQRKQDNIHIISNMSNRLHIDELNKILLIKKNWQTDYAVLKTNNQQMDIVNYMTMYEKNKIDFGYGIENTTKVSPNETDSTSVKDRTIPMLACINFI